MKSESLPKVQLYVPLKFWSMIMVTLDHKIEELSKGYGHGTIGMEIVVRKGKIKDVVFNDQLRVRQETGEEAKELGTFLTVK